MARVHAGDFLEWAEVYGNFYGTLRAPVETTLGTGDSILLDIDTKGAEQVRSSGTKDVSIFVLPPSVSVLEKRLARRGTDEPQVIARRIDEASVQLRECGTFDYLVVNDDLESAHDQFQAIIVAELMRVKRHPALIKSFSR
jgi:guanylate kinase